MPSYWQTWKKISLHYGFDFNEKRFYSMAGVPVRDIIKILIDESMKEPKPAVDDVVAMKRKFYEEVKKEMGIPLIPVVVDIAKEYYGKIPLAVASSGFKDHVVDSLEMNGILDLFDAIITAEDIENPKPAPDIFLKAAEKVKCDPSKCRGFEDADFGMQALHAAGMEAIDVRLMKGYPKPNPSPVSVLQEALESPSD